MIFSGWFSKNMEWIAKRLASADNEKEILSILRSIEALYTSELNYRLQIDQTIDELITKINNTVQTDGNPK